MAENQWALPDGFDDTVKKALSVLFKALKNAKKAIPPAALEAVRLGDWETFQRLMNWNGIESSFDAFQSILSDQAKAAAVQFYKDGGVGSKLTFDLIDERAVFFAQTRAAELVTEITNDMRANIRNTITSATLGEKTWQQAAEEINANLPLTSRDAAAVEKYRLRQYERFMKKGMTDAAAKTKAARLRDSYAEKLTQSRASTIARTEIATAASEGRYLGWEAGVQSGMVDNASVKEWIAEPSACEICSSMDGKTIPWDDAFPAGMMMPPAHPNCRCAAAILPPDYADSVFTNQAMIKSKVNQFEVEFAKHLLGQHDQSTHAGGHSTSRPYELKPHRLYQGYKTSTLVEESKLLPMQRYNPPISANGDYTGNYQTAQGVAAQANTAMSIASIATGKKDDVFAAEIRNDPDYPKMPKALQEAYDNATWKNEFEHPDLEAYLKKENQFVTDKLRAVQLDDGTTVGQVMDDMAKVGIAELTDIAINKDLTLTMPLSRFKAMMADERYKTVYEAKRSGKGGSRDDYLEARYNVETKLGVPTNTQDSQRPVYGIFGDSGMTYGDVRIVMKDELKHRTTVSIGDSIDGQVDKVFWASDLADGKVTNADFIDSMGRRISRYAFNDYVSTWFEYDKNATRITGYKGLKSAISQLAEYKYAETQIHGGVKISDLSKVILPPSFKIPAAMQSALDENGIVVEREEIERTNVG